MKYLQVTTIRGTKPLLNLQQIAYINPKTANNDMSVVMSNGIVFIINQEEGDRLINEIRTS